MNKDKTMETQLITIPVTTDMDTAQLLDIVNTQIAQILEDEKIGRASCRERV